MFCLRRSFFFRVGPFSHEFPVMRLRTEVDPSDSVLLVGMNGQNTETEFEK